jgi:ribonuclease P protein component
MEPGREAHLPAEQPPPGTHARLPAAHADPSGPGHHPRPTSQGPGAALRLSRTGSVALPATGGVRLLPPHNRLRLTRHYQRATRLGARGRGELVVVHVAADEAGDVSKPPRVGIIVGRVVGSAVIRNAVQRRLRHLMRERLDRVPAGSLVVVRALGGTGGVPSAVLASDLDTALDRAVRSYRERGHRRGGRR